LSNTLTAAAFNDTEPNDVPAQALTIAQNGSKTGHIGYRYNGGSLDQDDYYKLVTTTDGNLTVNFQNNNNTYQYVYLYDNDGTTQLTSTQGNAQAGISLTANGIAAGTYYIRVSTPNNQNYSNYTLSNTIAPTAFNDVEPNDIPAQALTIAQNGSKTGHIGYRFNGGSFDQDDYYKLVTNTDGNITFSLQNDNDHYHYVYLYDNDGTTQLGSTQGNALAGISTTVIALAAGTYYIRVYTPNNQNYSNYTLSNTLAPTAIPFNDPEPNNYFIQALTLNPNDSAKGHVGYRLNGGDVDYSDYYKLVTTTDGNINISFNNDNNAYTYIYLYDKDTVNQVGSTQGNAQAGLGFTINGLAAGTYYVRVYAPNSQNYCGYTLKDSIYKAVYTNDVEPNDGFATATTLNNDSAKSGHIGYRFNGGAVDYYDYRKVIMYTAGSMAIDITMATAGYSYVYLYNPAQSQIYSQQGNNAIYNISFPSLAAGDYYLLVSAPNNQNYNSYKITRFEVPCNTDPSAITAGGPTTFCQGGSVALNSTIEYASYLWSNGATTRNITVSTAGTYTLTGTDYDGCATHVSNSIPVTVNPTPTTPTITPGSATTFCQGENVTLTSSAAASYLWSPGGETTPSITVNSNGNYSVTVKSAAGCSSLPSTVTAVTVNPLPAIPTISAEGPTTFCQGGSVTLTSSATSGNLWSNNATTQSITVNSNGDYSVTVTNANNCSATSTPTTVTVNPLPATPTISAGGVTTFCAGGSVTLTSSATSGNVWSNNETSQSITVNANGDYSVTVTNANNCSATSTPTTVTVNPLPTVTLASFTAVCSTDAVFALSGGSPAGGTYSGTGVNGGQFDPATAGVGTFTITYSYTNANNCTATATQSITVNNCGGCTPTISTGGGAITFCEGGSVTLTASAGTNYLWSPGGETTQSITVNSSGTYTVTVTNANNCTATSSAIVVTVNPLPAIPTISAGGPTIFCQGGSVTFTSSAISGNVWSNNATTQSITVNTNGDYSVTVTNANGCSSASTPTTVTVNPLPTVTLAPFTAVCSTDATFALSGGSPAGGTYSGTGVSGGQFDPASAGIGTFTITYSYTNANNCSVTATQSITVNNCGGCNATITADKSTTFCKGGSVKLTASTGSSYLWSSGATTQSIIVNSSGTFTVTVTNTNNCTATSAPMTVTVNDLPQVPIITASGPTTFCTGGSVTLTSTAAASYLWNTGATTQSITVSNAGNYAVIVKNASGCTRTSAITTVTVNTCGGVYCNANGNNKNKGYIHNVYFRNIFNTTGWSNGGYGDYLNQSASVTGGANYIISVTPGFNLLNSTSGLFTRVWIDWNHDGDFNDPGELVFAPTGASYFLRLGVIHVPNNALNGTTRMRVAMKADGPALPCGSFAYGEVEDYTVVVGGCSSGGSKSIEPVPTEEITMSETFNLYPNPVSAELVIQKLSNDNSKVVATNTSMQILDMNGRIVLSSILTRSTEVIDVRRLTAGIYFVRLNTGIKFITQKIIIAH
jgi:hypothetical protein